MGLTERQVVGKTCSGVKFDHALCLKLIAGERNRGLTCASCEHVWLKSHHV